MIQGCHLPAKIGRSSLFSIMPSRSPCSLQSLHRLSTARMSSLLNKGLASPLPRRGQFEFAQISPASPISSTSSCWLVSLTNHSLMFHIDEPTWSWFKSGFSFTGRPHISSHPECSLCFLCWRCRTASLCGVRVPRRYAKVGQLIVAALLQPLASAFSDSCYQVVLQEPRAR
jgi:hypothetical protein